MYMSLEDKKKKKSDKKISKLNENINSLVHKAQQMPSKTNERKFTYTYRN